MERKKPCLSLKGVSFSYEQNPIIENANLDISEGEFVGIFGPNGGGKTTLLQIVMGFLPPDHGSVNLWGAPPKDNCKQIGYVPQVTRFDKQFPITVQEVVEMSFLSKLTLFGKIPSNYKQRVDEFLEKVGMLEWKKHSFGSLSGGQAQRVLIARALASKPKLLILDEPTASVDPKAEEDIIGLLESLKGQITILMVTHDLETIVHKVKTLLCVHRQVHTLSPTEVCEHFGLGLYHSPIIQKKDKGSN